MDRETGSLNVFRTTTKTGSQMMILIKWEKKKKRKIDEDEMKNEIETKWIYYILVYF